MSPLQARDALDNLALSSWTTISTNTIPPGGLFEFIDSNVPPVAVRFYRTRLR